MLRFEASVDLRDAGGKGKLLLPPIPGASGADRPDTHDDRNPELAVSTFLRLVPDRPPLRTRRLLHDFAGSSPGLTIDVLSPLARKRLSPIFCVGTLAHHEFATRL